MPPWVLEVLMAINFVNVQLNNKLINQKWKILVSCSHNVIAFSGNISKMDSSADTSVIILCTGSNISYLVIE